MFHRHFSPCFLVKAPDWPAHLCTIARSSPSGWRWVRMARGSRDRDHLHVPQLPYKPLSLHSIFYPWWFLNVFDNFKLYMCMYVVCMYVYVYVYVYIYIYGHIISWFHVCLYLLYLYEHEIPNVSDSTWLLHVKMGMEPPSKYLVNFSFSCASWNEAPASQNYAWRDSV
jgi:hypothetical protein